MTKRERVVLYSLLIINLMTGLLYVVMSNHIATLGIEVYDKKQQIKKIHAENNALYIEILSNTSLLHIASEAAREGFIPGKLVPLP